MSGDTSFIYRQMNHDRDVCWLDLPGPIFKVAMDYTLPTVMNRRPKPFVYCWLLMAVVHLGCDTGPELPDADKSEKAHFALQAASIGGGWEPVVQKVMCRTDPDGAGRKVNSATFQLDETGFSLSLIDITSSRPPQPASEADTVVINGSVERYGSLLLLRDSTGGVFYAAVGPTPEVPTTIALSDPYGSIGICTSYRFVAEGENSTNEIRGDVAQVEYAFGTPLPYFYYAGSTIGSVSIQEGSITLDETGHYLAWLKFTGDRVGSGGSVARGRYVANGPLTALNPLEGRQAFALVNEDGRGVIRRHHFSFDVANVHLPGGEVQLIRK